MQIDIRGQNVPISGALAAHCLDRLDRALRPFSSRIARVQVAFVDLNGPRIPAGQACRITVELQRGGRLRFESRTDSYYQSASQSISGIVRPIQRALSRHRDGARASRPQPLPPAA